MGARAKIFASHQLTLEFQIGSDCKWRCFFIPGCDYYF